MSGDPLGVELIWRDLEVVCLAPFLMKPFMYLGALQCPCCVPAVSQLNTSAGKEPSFSVCCSSLLWREACQAPLSEGRIASCTGPVNITWEIKANKITVKGWEVDLLSKAFLYSFEYF